MPVLARNKKAYFDYEVLQKYEAGLKLLGHEVKSIKDARISLKGSFVTLKQLEGNRLPELYLINAHVPLYKHAGNIKDYDPYRSRKLLLKKREIAYLVGKKQEQGLTLIPLKMYTKRSLLKLEFALAKGKKKFDKRENIKKRDLERRQRELLKRSVRG
jgi:SsrA-binding protein